MLFAVVVGTTGLGLLVGRRVRHHSETLREPLAAVHTALLGLVGLILAFGLALAVGRYETRRTALVDESNTIGTTYLRAQTLAEPVRTASLETLRRYTDNSILLADAIPESDAETEAVSAGEELQRRLWALAGRSLDAAPQDTAPRLYVDSLNQMIDQRTVRTASLNNRVPGAVLVLEIVGAALALGMLATYLALVGRGVYSVVLAASLVSMLLLVTFDLDRPTRGFIQVPDTTLRDLREEMEQPPAARPPRPVPP
jgi:hypothetical protein